MATVNIAGVDLDVRPATLGFLRNSTIPWKDRLRSAQTEAEAVDATVEGFLLWIGHNPGVNAAWVLENIPEDSREVMERIRTAGGLAAAENAKSAAGEAKRP
jgi:hypothetical protein